MATQEQPKQSSELSPSQALLQMTAGYWISQAIYVAAKLGIADFLRDGPRSSEELAQSTGAHPRALYRLLRALASVEVFHEREDGGFELTPRAACLLSDVPGSLRAIAIVRGEPYFWEPWGRLLQSVGHVSHLLMEEKRAIVEPEGGADDGRGSGQVSALSE